MIRELVSEFSRLENQAYYSLKTELEVLCQEISEVPTSGTPLGNDVYKIRLAISSKGKGKSGGASLIKNIQNFQLKS